MNRRIPDELLRHVRESPTSFPEIHAVGGMRPHSQTIHLYHGRKSDIKNATKSKIPMERARPAIETIIHEVTHWYDLIGTVWGQNYLKKLFTCIDIDSTRPNSAESEFYNIIDLYDEDRRILFPLYYHMVLDEPQKHSTKKALAHQL